MQCNLLFLNKKCLPIPYFWLNFKKYRSLENFKYRFQSAIPPCVPRSFGRQTWRPDKWPRWSTTRAAGRWWCPATMRPAQKSPGAGKAWNSGRRRENAASHTNAVSLGFINSSSNMLLNPSRLVHGLLAIP